MNPKVRQNCEKCKKKRRFNQKGECIFCNMEEKNGNKI